MWNFILIKIKMEKNSLFSTLQSYYEKKINFEEKKMKLIFMYNLDKEYWYHLCETLLLELRISWSVVFILLHVFSHLPHKAYPMLPRDNLLRWLSQLWFSLEKIIFLGY